MPFSTYGFLCNNRKSKCDDEGKSQYIIYEYIIICQDGLYIVSTTPEEISHKLKDKQKINIYIQDKYPHDPGGKENYQIKEYLEHLYESMNILFTDNLPQDLHIAFEIIKLLIEKGNLNLIHNKNSY